MSMSFTETNAGNRTRGVVGLWLGLCLGVAGCSSLPIGRSDDPAASAPSASSASASAAQAGTGSVEHDVAVRETRLSFDDLPDQRPQVRVRGRSNEQFEAALSALDVGELAEAEQLLLGLTRSQPELSGPWLNLGQVYLGQDRESDAQEAFERAILANPANCAAYNQLGVLARRAGRFNDAEASYLACIQRDPSFPEVHLNLGILYELYLGRLPQALAAYRTYQELADDHAQVDGWVMDLERRL